MVKEQVIEKVKLFIEDLKRANIKVNKVFLFGSHIFGRDHEYSDIDVAVISPDFGKNYLEDCRKLMQIAHKIDLLLSPEPYSLDEYEKAKRGDFLWQEIIQKGIPIEV